MAINPVCPKCKRAFHKKASRVICLFCQAEYGLVEGCIDFVEGEENRTKDKIYYDRIYNNLDSRKTEKYLPRKNFDQIIREIWFDKTFPSGKDILSKLPNLRNKEILCLGNGASMKEIYFAINGGSLWISDLSIDAVLKAKNSLPLNLSRLKVQFHAIDATQLPFENESLDVVYGYAFVHHLPDKLPFLREIFRVLKRGGMCIFFDNAFSPIWQRLKTGLLKPLMQHIHKKRGISPEDLRATLEGGFTKDQVIDWGFESGFNSYFFIKKELLLYFWLRGTKKVFNRDRDNRVVYLVGSMLSFFDSILESASRLYQDNMIRVVWGYRKT